MYRNTTKMHTERWKQSSTFKQRLKTLLLTVNMCTGLSTDVMLHTFVFLSLSFLLSLCLSLYIYIYVYIYIYIYYIDM